MEVFLLDINEWSNGEDNNCITMLSVQIQMVALHVTDRVDIQEMEQYVMVNVNYILQYI